MPSLPPLRCDPGALAVICRLRDAGHCAYLVGGCVRDQLLGRPAQDWDIATDAVPEQIAALFEHTIPVGKAFGVMLVVLPAGTYEVATFRGEGQYSDGRRPDHVEFTGPEQDVARRDFTINALMYDPLEARVLDWVGGVEDLQQGLVRTVGDPRQRFAEDHLRLLRAVRFAARTGFHLDPATAAAMRQLAALAASVSGERLGDELTRMLSEGAARRSLELLDATGLLAVVLPEVAQLHGVTQPPEFHPEGDVWAHTLAMLGAWDVRVQALPQEQPPGLSGEAHDCAVLGWATLLHDVGKPETRTEADRICFYGHDAAGATVAEAILTRLRRATKLIQPVVALVAKHMHFMHVPAMREAKRRRFLRDETFPYHLELHRLDCEGSHGKLEVYAQALLAYEQEQATPPVLAPLLRGDDLLTAGYRRGPQMGQMLRAVEDARLEHQVATREEALAWVKREFPQG
jgi:poly(A) polymerase